MGNVFRAWSIGLLAFLVVWFGACSSKNKELAGNTTVKGKVTYQGKAVPFGFVVLYPMPGQGPQMPKDPENFDPKASLVPRPSAVIPIGKDGEFQAINLPEGAMQVFVMTDPSVTMPDLLSGQVAPSELTKFDIERLAKEKSKDIDNAKKKFQTKDGKDIPEMPMPGQMPYPPFLSDDEKKLLTEIHEKYFKGTGGRPILLPIGKSGEQLFNIELD